jgi:hypothetical protein
VVDGCSTVGWVVDGCVVEGSVAVSRVVDGSAADGGVLGSAASSSPLHELDSPISMTRSNGRQQDGGAATDGRDGVGEVGTRSPFRAGDGRPAMVIP